MSSHRSRTFGLSISLADTTLYLAWLSGILLGVGCATEQKPLIAGGAAMSLLVMFGFRRLKEGSHP